MIEDVGGSGVSVTIQARSELRVYDLLAFAGDPIKSDQALIDWNWEEPGEGTGKTTILFSQPVSEVSLEAGDWGSDADSPLELMAYSEVDELIASASTDWAESWLPPFASFGVSASGIRKVTFSSGGRFPNSVFLDNLSFEPEAARVPATIGNSLRTIKLGSSVILAWPFVPDAASFNIYRSTVKADWPAEPYLSGLLGTTGLIPDLGTERGLVIYRVTAVNFDGEEGG